MAHMAHGVAEAARNREAMHAQHGRIDVATATLAAHAAVAAQQQQQQQGAEAAAAATAAQQQQQQQQSASAGQSNSGLAAPSSGQPSSYMNPLLSGRGLMTAGAASWGMPGPGGAGGYGMYPPQQQAYCPGGGAGGTFMGGGGGGYPWYNPYSFMGAQGAPSVSASNHRYLLPRAALARCLPSRRTQHAALPSRACPCRHPRAGRTAKMLCMPSVHAPPSQEDKTMHGNHVLPQLHALD